MRRVLETIIRWLGEALVRLYYPMRVVDGRGADPGGQADGVRPQSPQRVAGSAGLAGGDRAAVAVPGQEHAVRQSVGAAGHGGVRQHPRVPGARRARSRATPRATRRASRAAGRSWRDGGALALFPEGVSHSDPQMRPLKTGAARIALSAEAEQTGGSASPSCPVGLFYERKTTFRSSRAAGGRRADRDRAAAARLPQRRARGRRRADRRDRRAPRRGGAAGRVARAAGRHRARGALDRRRGERGDRTIWPRGTGARASWLAAYGALRARDPGARRDDRAEVRGYGSTLRRLGVRDPWALEMEAPRARRLAAPSAKLVLARAAGAGGRAHGLAPYRLAGVVAQRVTKDEDVLSTVKMLAGALFLLLAWTAEAMAAGCALGRALARAGFRAGVGSGYVALRFEELRARPPRRPATCRCAPSTATPPGPGRRSAARAGRRGGGGAARGGVASAGGGDRKVL